MVQKTLCALLLAYCYTVLTVLRARKRCSPVVDGTTIMSQQSGIAVLAKCKSACRQNSAVKSTSKSQVRAWHHRLAGTTPAAGKETTGGTSISDIAPTRSTPLVLPPAIASLRPGRARTPAKLIAPISPEPTQQRTRTSWGTRLCMRATLSLLHPMSPTTI